MSRPTTADTVVENINMLLDIFQWNVPHLAKVSKVPKRTIYSILNKERTPGIDTTDEIAKAFGLDGWHLLKPKLVYDIAKNGKLDKLIDSYGKSTSATQEYINHVLDMEGKVINGN